MAGKIKAGEAFVKVYADGTEMDTGLKNAQKKLRAFSRSVGAIGKGMMGIGAAIVAPLGVAVKIAGDAVETVNKFEAVFREGAKAAGEFADEISKALGRSRYDLRDALSSMQAFLVGLGFAGEEARKMSQEMTQLSLDFASFYNIQDPEALEKFQSGLAGMSRPLELVIAPLTSLTATTFVPPS